MNQLPDHILVEIFRYFGTTSLITLMKVCDRWSNLIQTSKKLTKRFNLIIINSECNDVRISDPFSDDSKHSNISLIGKNLRTSNKLEFIETVKKNVENHKNSLQKLNFRGSNIPAYIDVLEQTLGLFCDFIKEVEIVDILVNNSDDIKELKWKNLKSLKINKSSADLMLFFENSELSKLELSSIKTRYNVTIRLESFWKNQTKLKELKITKTDIPIDTLVDVLNRQNLSKLELDIKLITINSEKLLLELSKDCHWKKLSFKNGPSRERSCQTVMDIIAAHSCIEELKFYKTAFSEADSVISRINKHIPHIQHLRLPLNYGLINFKESFNFEKLEILEFEGIKYRLTVQKLFHVLKMCKNLKILRIFWVGYHARVSAEFFKNIFEAVKNLEELHIGYKSDTFELTDEDLKVIKEDAKNLKKLKTFSSDVKKLHEKLKIFDENGVKCVVLDKNYGVKTGTKTYSWAPMTSEQKVEASCEWSD